MGLIVFGLSTLTVMELGTPSRTKTSAPDPFEQLTVDVSVSSDTLETADRLEIHHLAVRSVPSLKDNIGVLSIGTLWEFPAR
jgi:hypothetical protein